VILQDPLGEVERELNLVDFQRGLCHLCLLYRLCRSCRWCARA